VKVRAMAVASALVLALAATACADLEAGGGGDDGDMSITVGLPVHDSSYAPVYLAVDKGFFAEEGVEVELVAFSSGSDLAKALIGGSIDIANSALSETVSAVQEGQPVKAFWGGMNMTPFEWWARPPIRTVADAVGKKWGVTRVGSSTDFLTRYLMTRHGIDPEKDATIVGVGAPAGSQAAIEADQIQVATASQPNTFVFEDLGYTRIASLSDFSSSYPTHVSYSREELQNQNPRAVEAYLRALSRGTELAKKDRAAAEATMMTYAKVEQKHVGRTYDANLPGWAEDGALPPQADMDVFWDIGVQNKQFAQKLPEERWLNRTWLDRYPDLGSKGDPAP
jgi:NitT/TauT family transport system substrate-binding protein